MANNSKSSKNKTNDNYKKTDEKSPKEHDKP